MKRGTSTGQTRSQQQDLYKILEFLDSGESGQQGHQEPGTGFSLLYSTLGYLHHQRNSQGIVSDTTNVGGLQGAIGIIPNGVMHASTIAAITNNTGSGHGHNHNHPARRCPHPENITTGVISKSQNVPAHVTLCKNAMRRILKRHKAIQERISKGIEDGDKSLLDTTTTTQIPKGLNEENENGNNNDDNERIDSDSYDDEDSEEEEEDEEDEEDDDDDEDYREDSAENADDEEDEEDEESSSRNSNNNNKEDDGACGSSGNGRSKEGKTDNRTRATLRKIRRVCGCGCKDLIELVLHNLGGAAFSSTIARVMLDLPVVQAYNSYSKDKLCEAELQRAVDLTLGKNRDTFVQYMLGERLCFWVLGCYLLGFATADELTEIRDSEIPDLKGIQLTDYDDVSFYLCSSVANSAKYDTLHGAILRFLENELLYAAQDSNARGPGLSHTDDIVDFVLSNWCRPHADITDDVLRQEVLATLQTSPLFAQSRSSPGFWRPSPLSERILPKEWRLSPDVLAGKRPVRSSRDGTTVAAASLLLAAEKEKEAARQSKAAAAQTGGKKHKSFADADGGFASAGGNGGGGGGGNGTGDRDAEQGAGAKIRTGPKFLSCSRCGTDIPGRGPNAGWKIGQNRDDVLCLDCCVVVNITVSCMICGKQYSRGDENSEEEMEEEGENEWICCDGCHRWAMVGCDSSIIDIKEYDESLDNPKKYFCPFCVDHKRQMQYFRFLAESTEKNSESVLLLSQRSSADAHEPSLKKARFQILPDEVGCETDEYVEAAVKEFTDEIYPALLAENARALTLDQKEEVAALKEELAKKIRYMLREKVRSHNESMRKLNADLEVQISCLSREMPCIFREHLEKIISAKQKH